MNNDWEGVLIFLLGYASCFLLGIVVWRIAQIDRIEKPLTPFPTQQPSPPDPSSFPFQGKEEPEPILVTRQDPTAFSEATIERAVETIMADVRDRGSTITPAAAREHALMMLSQL